MRLVKDDIKHHQNQVAQKAQKELFTEEAFNDYKRYMYTKDVHQLLKEKKHQKDLEQKEKLQNKVDYQQMCDQRFKAEEAKENQYKQFFKDYEKAMHSRMNKHISNVLKEDYKKQKEIDKQIMEAEMEYNKKLKDREIKGMRV